MSNITSNTLQRITNRSEINNNDYYFVKFRVEERMDCIGYFLTSAEIRREGMEEIAPSTLVFRRIWQRRPRSSEQDAYNKWVNIDRWNQHYRNNQIYKFLPVTNVNFRTEQVLIYSFGEMQQLLNEDDNPDLLYQYFQQRQRKNKLQQQVKENSENETMKNEDSGIEESNIPTLQYLAKTALLKRPDDVGQLLKDNVNIDMYKIHKKYTGWGDPLNPPNSESATQNAGKSKKQRKSKKHRKSKKQRKSKKHRK